MRVDLFRIEQVAFILGTLLQTRNFDLKNNKMNKKEPEWIKHHRKIDSEKVCIFLKGHVMILDPI